MVALHPVILINAIVFVFCSSGIENVVIKYHHKVFLYRGIIISCVFTTTSFCSIYFISLLYEAVLSVLVTPSSDRLCFVSCHFNSDPF